MPRGQNFWRNALGIALAHLLVLLVVLHWSSAAQKPVATDIVWLEGGASSNEPEAESSQPEPTPNDESAQTEIAAAEPAVTPMEDPLTMRIPPTPDPDSPTPTPKPSPTARPSPTAKPKPTPKPKKSVVEKSNPKPKATPAKKKTIAVKKVSLPAKTGSKNETKSGAGGSGGHGQSTANASQFGWYGNMLHDRFFGEWAQPTSIAMSGARMSALVRIRIEKDGRISAFDIVRSSGNVVVDESVSAIAKRVAKVDPPPAALIAAGHYDVRINFELNPE